MRRMPQRGRSRCPTTRGKPGRWSRGRCSRGCAAGCGGWWHSACPPRWSRRRSARCSPGYTGHPEGPAEQAARTVDAYGPVPGRRAKALGHCSPAPRGRGCRRPGSDRSSARTLLRDAGRQPSRGAPPQRSAAGRLDLGKVAFKSKVNSARRRLRVAVEAGLALALDGREADALPDAADLTQDVRPPRR